ncbi:MAG: tetratricopeptide repeat protein, partial [Candidatus Saccharimonadales bacterium]
MIKPWNGWNSIVLGLTLWALAGTTPGVAKEAQKAASALPLSLIGEQKTQIDETHDQISTERTAREALAEAERKFGPTRPDVVTSLDDLASVLQDQGKLAEAEELYRRALAITEKVSGPVHADTSTSLDNLASVLQDQGKFAEAEGLHRRALAITEKVSGPVHPDTSTSLNNLALVLQDQGKLAEAEGLHRRALAITEKVSDLEDSETAASLNNLASVLHNQGKFAEAEELYRHALTISEKASGTDHPNTATSLDNLAVALQGQGKRTEAEGLHRRALTIREKIYGPEHPDVATSLNNLASLLQAQGKLAEAEPLYRRALAISEKALGLEHPDTARNFNNLATVLQGQGKLAEAEELYHRALAIIEQTNVLQIRLLSNANLGFLFIQRRQLKEAVPHFRRAVEVLDQLFANTQGLSEETRHTFLGQYAYIYREYLELLLHLHEHDAKAGYDREFLAVASRNQSRIFSELLRQGKVRAFSQEPAFIALRDRRESLLNQLLTLREQRATLLISAPNVVDRKAALSQQINALSTDLGRVEAQLQRDYPRYLELIQPAPVTVEQLQQSLLQPNEVLLTFVLLPEKTVLLAVSRDRFSLQTVSIGRDALTQRIHTLRKGLRLDDQGGIITLSQLDPSELHALYRDLIAPIEPQLGEGKRLLIVADGPLYSLPLELLVTTYDDAQQRTFEQNRKSADGSAEHPLLDEYAALTYLGQRYQFHYLPSLAALAAQR